MTCSCENRARSIRNIGPRHNLERIAMDSIKSLLTSLLACGILAAGIGVFAQAGAAPAKKLHIYLLPKVKGIPYFETCAKGAQEAAKELGHEVTYDGPVSGKAQEAARNVEQWTL